MATSGTTRRRSFLLWDSPRDAVPVGVQLLGVVALAVPGGEPEHYSALRFGWFVFGMACVVAGLLADAHRSQRRAKPERRSRETRFSLLFGLFVCGEACYEIGGVLAKTSAHAGTRYIVGIVAFMFFLLPVLAFVRIGTRLQDEMQRSVLAGAATVTLAALIMGSVGYSILERAIGLPAIPAIFIAPIAGGVWLLVWFVLSRKYA